MTGGEALVAGLRDHHIDTVFGLPGAQTYGLFDALHRAQKDIRVIGARHEQACAYMAFGYTRSTGRPSVFSVVPGPGMLNASAGLLTAFGALLLRLQGFAFGAPSGNHAPVRASYLPVFAHLVLVLIAGVYLPPMLVSWFQHVARMLG